MSSYNGGMWQPQEKDDEGQPFKPQPKRRLKAVEPAPLPVAPEPVHLMDEQALFNFYVRESKMHRDTYGLERKGGKLVLVDATKLAKADTKYRLWIEQLLAQ